MSLSFVHLFTLSLCLATRCGATYPRSEIDEIWKSHCSKPHPFKIVQVKCSSKFQKIYLFDPNKKDYDSARRYCKEKFNYLKYADLVSFKNCEEYKQIQGMLATISEENPHLWKESDDVDGYRMDIWTGGYNIPPAGSVTTHDNSSSDDAVDLNSLCDPQASVPTTTTSTTTERSSNLTILSANVVKGHANTTSIFTPWEQRENDLRFTMCEFRVPYADVATLPTTEPEEVTTPVITTSSDPSSSPTTQASTSQTSQKTTSKTSATTHASTHTDSAHDKFHHHHHCKEVTDCPKGTNGHRLNCPNGKNYDLCYKNSFAEINSQIENAKSAVNATGPQNATSIKELSRNLIQEVQRVGDNMTGGDVVQFLRCAGKIHDVMKSDPKISEADVKKVSRTMIKGFSLVLDGSNAWKNIPPENRTESAARMISHVTDMAFTLACQTRNETRINDSNIVMEVYTPHGGTLPPDFMFPTTQVQKIPSTVKFTSGVLLERQNCGRHVASGIIYQKIAAHMLDDHWTHRSSASHSINSNLVSFALRENDKVIQKLPNDSKVQITLAHLEYLNYGDEISCVFWDFNGSRWSDYHCHKIPELSFRNQTVCECNHLTNFAALMDISNRESNDSFKSKLTTVCCCLSIFGLSATILLLIFIKSLRNRRSVITGNLSACLLVVNLLVVFGFDQNDHYVACRVISALTLYALLSAFFWMLMEGYLLYQMVIIVFRSIGEIDIFWLYIVGYGPSLITVITFVAVTGFEGLFDPPFSYFCWISNRKYPHRIWGLAGPAFVIILINIIILIISLKAALNSHQKRPNCPVGDMDEKHANLAVVKRWLKGWASLMILVGVTWGCGVFYVLEFSTWLSYPFIILNGLQGLFIFLFEIVFNGKSRKTLLRHFFGTFPSASKYLPNLTKSASNQMTSLKSRSSNLSCSSSLNGSNPHLFKSQVSTNPSPNIPSAPPFVSKKPHADNINITDYEQVCSERL